MNNDGNIIFYIGRVGITPAHKLLHLNVTDHTFNSGLLFRPFLCNLLQQLLVKIDHEDKISCAAALLGQPATALHCAVALV